MTFPRQSVAPLVVRDPIRGLLVQNRPRPLGQAQRRHANGSGVANLFYGEFLVLGRFFL